MQETRYAVSVTCNDGGREKSITILHYVLWARGSIAHMLGWPDNKTAALIA